MHNLQLAINFNGWRLFARRRADKAFSPIADKVFKRDQFTCQYCGFQAKQYQEVVNLDGNYTHNKLSNLITACCFCSQCLFLESTGFDEMGGGQLIYFPEMSQSHLNSFCHVLFCGMGSGTGYQETSQSIYRSLKFRSQPIETKFGEGASHPATFGRLVMEYEMQHAAQLNLLNDLRLLPSYTKFKVQLDAWAAAALEELSAESTEST